MIYEIRGDVKKVNRGVMEQVDLFGCEKYYALFLIIFLIFFNLLLMWSYYQLLTILFFFIGVFIGRAIYKNDKRFFAVFFDNLIFDDESKKYLLPHSSLVKPVKNKVKSVRGI